MTQGTRNLLVSSTLGKRRIAKRVVERGLLSRSIFPRMERGRRCSRGVSSAWSARLTQSAPTLISDNLLERTRRRAREWKLQNRARDTGRKFRCNRCYYTAPRNLKRFIGYPRRACREWSYGFLRYGTVRVPLSPSKVCGPRVSYNRHANDRIHLRDSCSWLRLL